MKKYRIIALLLALLMVFSLCSAPALASDSSTSISTLSSSDKDEEAAKKEEEAERKKEEERRKKEEEEKKKEEERKKKEEEEKKKAEEEQKKKEEEEKKKAEEEEKKKEEEEKKKAEEEEKKKEEEEKKKEEEREKQENSGQSDSSGSSGSSKGDDAPDHSDGGASSASGDGSGGASDSHSGDGSGSASQSGSDGSSESDEAPDSSDPSESDVTGEDTAETIKPQSAKEDDTTKDEDKNKDQDKDEDKSSGKVHAKVVSDVSYRSTRTMTAASFSDYSNSTKKASGAAVSYKRLITLQVTDLVAGSASAGRDNMACIESVMNLVRTRCAESAYAHTLFKVIIPKGTYYIDGVAYKKVNKKTVEYTRCIHLYNNTWLSMNGVTLIKKDTLNRAFIRAGKSSESASGYNGESNIILEGGTIDVNIGAHNSSSKHFSGVRFGHDHDILIANVHFKGAVSGHQLELCGVKNVSVVGCSFTDYKDTGYTKGINRNEALQIDVTNSSNLTPTYARYDDTVSGNVVVYKNTFENLSRGVGSHSADYGKYYDNIVIQSNTFKNVKYQAIHCENYRDCAITNNKITNCGGGIEFNALCFAPDGNYYVPNSGLPKYSAVKTYNAKTVISGNKIKVKAGSSLSNASGIYVYGGRCSSKSRSPSSYYHKKFQLTGVTISKNTVTSARSAGIFLSYVGSYKVTGNKVSGIVAGSAARGCGIYLDHCAAGKLTSNTVSGTSSHGIYVMESSGASASRIMLEKNTINATAKAGSIGIYVKKSKYVNILSCSVTAKSYAVYLSGDSIVTIGSKTAQNKLTSSANYGIYATGKTKTGINALYNVVIAKKSAVHAAKGSKIAGSHNTFQNINNLKNKKSTKSSKKKK